MITLSVNDLKFVLGRLVTLRMHYTNFHAKKKDISTRDFLFVPLMNFSNTFKYA